MDFFYGRKRKPMKKLLLLASFALAATAAQAQCPYARRPRLHHAQVAPAPRARAASCLPHSELFGSSNDRQEQLQARTGVADAARAMQAMKNSSAQKPALVAQQDDGGNLVISKPRKTGPSGAATTSGQARLTAVNRQAKVITDENISSSGRP